MTFWSWGCGDALAAVLSTLREDLAAERAARAFAMQRLDEEKRVRAAVVEEYRRRLAIAQANFEWLSVAYNRLEAERSQLLLGRLGIVSPPLTVETQHGVGVPLGHPTPAAQTVPDDQTLTDVIASGSLFEDMGDSAARALGLDHADSVYDTETSLMRG